MGLRKWEYSRGQLATTIHKAERTYFGGSYQDRWYVITLVARFEQKWNQVERKYEKILMWCAIDRRRRVQEEYCFHYGLSSEDEAIELAERGARRICGKFVPGIMEGQRILTLTEGVLEVLAKLEG